MIRRAKRNPLLFLLMVLLPALLAAQSPAATPEGFLGIRIGMTLEEVKAALTREPLFHFRGDPDVSLVPATRQTLIEVPGNSYVERGYFQFNQNRLLVMIVMLNRELVSYYEVYSRLLAKYGDADSIDPSSAVWAFPLLRLSLEKPVVLKYVDRVAFDALTESSRVGRDYEEEGRDVFLDRL